MEQRVTANVIDAGPSGLTVHVPFSDWERFIRWQVETVEVCIPDGRLISPKQSRAIHAMVHDIAEFQSGFANKERVFNDTLRGLGLQYVAATADSEDVRYAITQNYCRLTDIDFFSLSPKKENCLDMTTASGFLGWLVDMCIEHAIPCCDSLLNRAEDVGRYLYSCVAHKRCCLCGQKADLHHTTTVGMGRNRREISHMGMMAEALCRVHHTECHNIGQMTFDNKYHIFGIKIDERLCEIHKLKIAG